MPKGVETQKFVFRLKLPPKKPREQKPNLQPKTQKFVFGTKLLAKEETQTAKPKPNSTNSA